MKTKSIIFSGLLLVTLGAATTSCEDMLSVEDELHTTNLAPQDTVYQLMGIINRMQSLVDRTVVLGELRADLVDLDPTVAKTSLQDVMNNNISTDNEYNQIADYYAVVNACNVYLTYVDSNFVSHNRKHFEKEIQAVRVFRAWTYLELAKVYGQVPFVLDPVLTSGDADDIVADATNRADMNDICTYFIKELLPYASKVIDMPELGSFSYDNNSSMFFIPVRLMLAELYLWRGSYTGTKADFVEACRYYHDYFCYTNKEVTTGTTSITWADRATMVDERRTSGEYALASDRIVIIPLDTCAYDGSWSELYGFFNSQYENNYYVPIVPSKRVRELSQEQIYCGYTDDLGNRDTFYSSDKEIWQDSLYKGDLRLSAVYETRQVPDIYTDRFSKDRQRIKKYMPADEKAQGDWRIAYLTLFRKNIVWLHFAEALNRAGFPETAMAVLKYGLSSNTMSNYVSDTERSELMQISTFFLGDLSSWSYTAFVDKHSPMAAQNSANMQGVHSRGCGDSYYNKYYVLPKDSALWAEVDSLNRDYRRIMNDQAVFQRTNGERVDTTIVYDDGTTYTYLLRYDYPTDSLKQIADSLRSEEVRLYNQYTQTEQTAYAQDYPNWIAAVEQYVLDEEAIEGMFEGYRFYDLMRYAMYHKDPNFIATQVARRKGATEHDTRADALKGGNWYLPLP